MQAKLVPSSRRSGTSVTPGNGRPGQAGGEWKRRRGPRSPGGAGGGQPGTPSSHRAVQAPPAPTHAARQPLAHVATSLSSTPLPVRSGGLGRARSPWSWPVLRGRVTQRGSERSLASEKTSRARHSNVVGRPSVPLRSESTVSSMPNQGGRGSEPAQGTAVAALASRRSPTILVGRRPELVEAIRTTRANPSYLPDFVLPDSLECTGDLARPSPARRRRHGRPVSWLRMVLARRGVVDRLGHSGC